ncbi:hypothetical protein [Mucilaginibacter celer]|uniref:Zf-HC2 domain-containing protein n=1 Tax=Mucilaginibacter celer TaxID=2305508 RepID=A0A494VWZ2_9SPHI|nr:hypothetical protein [Mucilaginibacter celer]AYL95838.1 hypothetical protein HYN43_011300 [Mucilaginibacter celer]
MKNILKNITQNCRKASWLIEKKQAGYITIREKLELKVHLTSCSGCRMFEQQSILINKLVRDVFRERQITGSIKLDDDFKKKMRDQIIEKLDKT